MSPLLDTKTYPNAVISENSNVVTIRAEEVGVQRMFINTSSVGDRRWSPLMEEDWHSICQAIFLGIDGQNWEDLYLKYVEMRKELNVKSPSQEKRR